MYCTVLAANPQPTASPKGGSQEQRKGLLVQARRRVAGPRGRSVRGNARARGRIASKVSVRDEARYPVLMQHRVVEVLGSPWLVLVCGCTAGLRPPHLNREAHQWLRGNSWNRLHEMVAELHVCPCMCVDTDLMARSRWSRCP